MDIVGGTYRELCEMPAWNAEFGSGGRAAAAVSVLSPGSTLHTYARNPNSAGITSLKALGVNVHAHPSSVALAFVYFHPLSRPHIEPPVGKIEQQLPIRVSGETVLRFGFLEGDAIVEANRAIYDPQTANDPKAFAANGSTARELALVMNELELSTVAGTDDITAGVERVMRAQGASVIVVKAGARGAIVFERSGIRTHVPAYRSTHVFKIGTGDVFSALFAFYWGEAGRPAQESADLASRSVASYCSTRQLPLPTGATENLQPVSESPPGPILLEGAINTIGRRYVMEEARYRLNELGATVISPSLEPAANEAAEKNFATMLVIADGMLPKLSDRVRAAHAAGVPIIVLAEDQTDGIFQELVSPHFTIMSDFSSALYFAVWAAMSECI